MQRGGEVLSVKAIAAAFAARLGDDYSRPITPRWIGAQLRNRLSLTPTKSRGTFILGPENATRLRALFERYGLGDMGDIGDIERKPEADATSGELPTLDDLLATLRSPQRPPSPRDAS